MRQRGGHGDLRREVYRPSWNEAVGPNDAVPNSQSGIVSLCHPWGAGVVKWLNEEVLGIVPTTPGFKTYDILPHPGRTLTQVSGGTPTPSGDIRASFELASGLCTLSAPVGTVGRIGIPKAGKTFAGSFHCNYEDYNTLWRKAARTAYLCMRERFYDCPDRERVGFWGDGTPELNQCFYVFDSNAHRLAKELVLRKLEPEFYPGQHMEFLGEYGLWFYYLHTGDLASIRKVYDQTRTFLLETYKSGNHGTWYDWGKEVKDIAVIEICFMYIDLQTLRKMAVLTGHDADIAVIDARLETIKGTFDKLYWKGNCYMSAQVTAPDDRANAIDGDHWTGWRDMTREQYPGQWFQVDLRQTQTFSRIILDNTWALWDAPDRYAVSVSQDGTSWSDPIATGSGQLGMTIIDFPVQNARYIRVTQTGNNATYHWSICEFDVCREDTGAGKDPAK